MATFAEMPLSTLRGACGVLRRRRAWAVSAEASWASPSAMHVALWLRSLRVRGPTAAHGALAYLVWLEQRLGLRTSSSSTSVKQQGSIAGGHVPVQAVLLRVRVWTLFEELLQATSPFIRAVALAWLLCTSGALRFAHLQRSTLLRTTAAGMFLRAARGKARTKGVRRPLEWTAPRWGLTKVDYSVFLDMHLSAVGHRGYLIPDFGPPRCNVVEAEHFQPFAMSLPKLMAVTSSLLQRPPASLTPSQVSDITSYSCRRTLPSLADRAGFGVAERVLLGGWQDSGGGAAELSKEARRLAMPMLYSDHKMLMQLRVKHELMEGVRLASASLRSAQGSAAAFDPDWDAISAHWPRREDTSAATDAVFLAAQGGQAKRTADGSATPAAAVPATPFLVPAPASPAQVRSSSSSSQASSCTASSSSWSSSSSSQRPVSTQCCPQLPWLLSKGRKGHLHLCSEEGGSRTLCGRNLRRPESGSGLEDAIATDKRWSPRCFGALPQEARSLLANAAVPL